MTDYKETIEMMGGLKAINFLPGLNVVTIKDAADYFGIHPALIYRDPVYENRGNPDSGFVRVTASQLEDAGYTRAARKYVNGDASVFLAAGGSSWCVSPKGMAMLMRSECGKNFREKFGIADEEQDAQKIEASSSDAGTDSETTKVECFTNSEFGELRVVMIEDTPWFVGKDVAEVLGYSKARNAIAAHVDEDDKKDAPIQGALGGKQYMTIINESGLYSLILSSKLPSAKKFKHWVTSEVLPSIRKHGAYMTNETIEKALLNPDFLIRLAQELKDEREKNEALKNENNALADGKLAMDTRDTLNRIVRKYARAVRCYYGTAWNDLKKEALYVLGINIHSRAAVSGETSELDRLSDQEIIDFTRLAVAMCNRAGVSVGDLVPRCKDKV